MTVEIKLSSLTVNVFESAIINHPKNQILHCLMWPWHAPGSPRRHVCTDNSLSALLLLFNMSHDLLFRCKARVVFQNVTNGKHPEKHRMACGFGSCGIKILLPNNSICHRRYLRRPILRLVV